MNRLVVPLIVLAVFTSLGFMTRVACGNEPSYLILRAPARAPKGHAYYPGRAYEVKARTYAYGWFGAAPSGHWKRTTGYNSNYIQWSKR